ncbi:hypothetical protein DAI22_12g117700 [Oryza sativa Japonica Group]|nr:hypothetical protein DAI22_12g117700 [Oryza sativa Japonica Group]
MTAENKSSPEERRKKLNRTTIQLCSHVCADSVQSLLGSKGRRVLQFYHQLLHK